METLYGTIKEVCVMIFDYGKDIVSEMVDFPKSYECKGKTGQLIGSESKKIHKTHFGLKYIISQIPKYQFNLYFYDLLVGIVNGRLDY